MLHPHLLFEILAMVAGFQLFLWLRRRTTDRIQTMDRIWILTAAAIGALLGARLLGGLESPSRFFHGGGELGWVYYLQRKTIVGGLLGGLIAVEWTKRRLGVLASSGDLFAYPLIVAIAIGRVGCFLTGLRDQTHGLPSSLPWAMDLGDGVPRHPAPLYEILFLAVLGGALWMVERRGALPEGRRFQWFMLGYLLFRLGADFLKPREPLPVLELTSIQLACALGVAYYLVVLGAKPPTQPAQATSSSPKSSAGRTSQAAITIQEVPNAKH